jgi:hypothetical protein
VKKTRIQAVMIGILVIGMAVVAGAQGPPPPGGFGRRGHGGPEGMGGPGGPGGMMGGGGGKCTAPCMPYQFSFTITSTQPVLVNGVASTINNTTTGTIARDANGSTYRDVKGAGLGPWAAQGGAQEFIFIRNLDPTVLMNYFVNVTKGTYEQFAIHAHTPRTGGQGKGPSNGGNHPNAPTPTAVTYVVPGAGAYSCAAEQTTFSHAIQLPGGGNTTITTNRVFCPALQVVFEEDHNDPRFGSRNYLLSDYSPTPSASLFAPPAGTTLVQGKQFGHGGPKGMHKTPPPPPAD